MGRIPKNEKDKVLEAFHEGGSNFNNHELFVQQNDAGNYEFKLKTTNNTTIATCTSAEDSIVDISKQISMTDATKLVCTVKSNTYFNNTTIKNTELNMDRPNDFLLIQSHVKQESSLPILGEMTTEQTEHSLKRRFINVSDTLNPSAIKHQTYTWTSQKSITESDIFPVHVPQHLSSIIATPEDVVRYPTAVDAITTDTDQKRSRQIIQGINNTCCDNPFNDRYTLNTQFYTQCDEKHRKQHMSLVMDTPWATEQQESVRNQFSPNILPVELISQTLSRSCRTSFETNNIKNTFSNNENIVPFIKKQNVVSLHTKEGSEDIMKYSVPYVSAIDIHKESILKEHSLSGSVHYAGSNTGQASVYTAQISPILAIGEIPGISQLLIKQEPGTSQKEDMGGSHPYTTRGEAEVQIVNHRQSFSPTLINVLIGHVLDTSDGAHITDEKIKQQCQQTRHISLRNSQNLSQRMDDIITKRSHRHSSWQENGVAEKSQNEMNENPFLPDNSITGVGEFLHAIENQKCSENLNDFELVASNNPRARDLLYYTEKHGTNARYAYTRTTRVASATKPSCFGISIGSANMSAHLPVCTTTIRPADDRLQQQKILLTLDGIGIGMNILNILKQDHREKIRLHKLGQV